MAERCPACGSARVGGPVLVSRDRVHAIAAHVEIRRCADCGTGVSEPRVGPDELPRFYPAEYAPYAEPPPGPLRLISRAIRGRQARIAWSSGPLSRARERTPGRALDVGCGRGDLAAALIEHGWEAHGVEPSPEAGAQAEQRGVTVHQGTLANVELEPETYDFALFHHSLEHTDDPERDLHALVPALRPGAVVTIVLPNFGGWQARRFGGCWYHLDVPRHRTHFTLAGLTALLERSGLKVLSHASPSTPEGLAASVQYRIWGRCLFPSGLSLRVATGLCALTVPLIRLLDRWQGGGDLLRVDATRPA